MMWDGVLGGPAVRQRLGRSAVELHMRLQHLAAASRSKFDLFSGSSLDLDGLAPSSGTAEGLGKTGLEIV